MPNILPDDPELLMLVHRMTRDRAKRVVRAVAGGTANDARTKLLYATAMYLERLGLGGTHSDEIAVQQEILRGEINRRVFRAQAAEDRRKGIRSAPGGGGPPIENVPLTGVRVFNRKRRRPRPDEGWWLRASRWLHLQARGKAPRETVTIAAGRVRLLANAIRLMYDMDAGETDAGNTIIGEPGWGGHPYPDPVPILREREFAQPWPDEGPVKYRPLDAPPPEPIREVWVPASHRRGQKAGAPPQRMPKKWWQMVHNDLHKRAGLKQDHEKVRFSAADLRVLADAVRAEIPARSGGLGLLKELDPGVVRTVEAF